MKLAHMIAIGTLGSLAAGLFWVSPAPAQGAGPSQGEIARQLLSLGKTRGLPTPGVAPAPDHNPALKPASTRVATQPARASKPQPAHTGVASVQPAPTPAAEHPKSSLDTIQFEFDSAKLLPQSIDTLKNLGNALNQELKDQKSFLIEGHTDAKGARPYNEELSKRRADAVKDYLVKEMGVAPDRLQTVGKGEADLALPRKPYAAPNRRVVVVNLGA
jgi:outer membrane protein OmpA-like peptidoglycan-associated protein